VGADRLMVRAFVRLGLVIVVVLLLQLSLISEMHLFTATGDILLLLAISAGIAAGPEWGALTGFIAGIAFDLVLQTPFGLSALSYCMVGYVVGRVQTGILRAAWWVPMVTAAIASAAGVVLFAVLEALLGDTHVFDRRLLSVIAVVSILNALLVPPMIRVFRWVFAEDALHQTRVWQ